MLTLSIKRHWNTLILDGCVPSDEIERLIDNWSRLVVDKLPQRQ